MPDLVIAGVGIHPFGRFPELDYEEMAAVAVSGALADAGISIEHIDAAICARMYLPATSGSRVLSRLTQKAIPVTDVEAACASGLAAVGFASALVASGQARFVLAFGVEKMRRGFMDPSAIYQPWQVAHGLAVNPSYWALEARRYMHEHGLTETHLAQVAEKNHCHSSQNENAMYTRKFTVEEILASPLVCDPLRQLEICAPNEGAAAAVITTQALASQLSSRSVRIRSVIHLTSLEPQLRAPAACLADSVKERSVSRLAASAAYEQAGIGPDELDLVELQDTDAFSEIKFYEELGLCAEGNAISLIESRDTWWGGRLPVNVSGGLISKGEPVGASALGQVHEVVLQLRGDAGARQLPDVRAGLTHVVGAGGNCGISILSI